MAFVSASVSFSKTTVEIVHLGPLDSTLCRLPITPSEPVECPQLLPQTEEELSTDEGIAETPIEFSLTSAGSELIMDSDDSSLAGRRHSMFGGVVRRLFPGSQMGSVDLNAS